MIRKTFDHIMQWIMMGIVALAFGTIGCNQGSNYKVAATPPDDFAVSSRQMTTDDTPRGVIVSPLDETDPQPKVTPAEKFKQTEAKLDRQEKPSPTSKPVPPTISEALANPKVVHNKTRYYVMQQGDTLWSVSKKFYGSGKHWKIIADANPQTDIRHVSVGQKIVVPYKNQ